MAAENPAATFAKAAADSSYSFDWNFDHPTPAYPGRIPPFRRNEFGFTNGGPIYIPHLYDGRNHDRARPAQRAGQHDQHHRQRGEVDDARDVDVAALCRCDRG